MHWNTRCKAEPPLTDEDPKSSCFGNNKHKEDDIEGRLAGHFGRDALITNRMVFIEHLRLESQNFKFPGKFVAEFQRQLS